MPRKHAQDPPSAVYKFRNLGWHCTGVVWEPDTHGKCLRLLSTNNLAVLKAVAS